MTGRRWLESVTIHLPGCYPSRVVMNEVGGYHPFAVHTEVFPTEAGRKPFLVTGQYCLTLEEAVAAFGVRALRDIETAQRAEARMTA